MKKTICVLLLVLSIFIMFSGLTMCISMTNQRNTNTFTTGKLVMEINDFPVIRDNEEWFPGRRMQKTLNGRLKTLEPSLQN